MVTKFSSHILIATLLFVVNLFVQFLTENISLAQTQIQTDQVLITERPYKKLKIFIEARNHPTQKGLDFFTNSDLKSQAVFHLNPGQVLSIELNYQDIIQREKNEQLNVGHSRAISIQEFKNLPRNSDNTSGSGDSNSNANPNESSSAQIRTQNLTQPQLYFADYWQNVNTLFNTSSGISAEPASKSNSPFVITKSDSQNLANSCDDENALCLDWNETSEINITSANIIQPNENKKFYQLIYHLSFTQKRGANSIWQTGWVLAESVNVRRDTSACENEICISRALLANQSKDVEKLFNNLELIEGTKVNKQKWDRTFFFLDLNKKTNDSGDEHFNRWIARMNKEIPQSEQRDEISYLFKIRPLMHLGLGVGTFSLEQSGDNNTFDYSAVGPALSFGLTFPLLLDVEWYMDADLLAATSTSSDQIDNTLSHFEMTNNITFSLPIDKWNASYYVGPGMTFRSIVGYASDVGYNTLYGIHLAQGLFFDNWTVRTHFGVTTRDLTGSLSKFEYGLTLDHPLPFGKGIEWHGVLKYTGYSAKIKDLVAATDTYETDEYKSSQIIGSIQREF